MNTKNAFTLIEVLMTIALVGILGGVSIGLFDSSLDEARFDATYKEMLQLRKTILGDLENTTVEGERIRFGFLGDVGSIPTSAQGLAAVYSQPASLSLWSIDATSKLGVGWNGPYIVSSTNVDYAKDAWGRNYIYVATATVPYILSYGSDGVVGGTGSAQDIQIDLPLSLRTATIYGQITQSGSVYEGDAYVQVFYPSSTATVSSQSVTLSSGNAGQFTFSSIPFGVRTVKIQIPNSTSPVMTMGPVTFAVDNQNYVLPSNILEVNPLMSDANCNTIANLNYVPGTMNNDTSNNKVSFRLKVNKSFATKTLYTSNDLVNGGATSRLEQVGIGGIVYGCNGIVDLILYGGGSRKFSQCELTCLGFMVGSTCIGFWVDIGYVTLNTYPNLTLGSTWGIPAGSEVEAFMKFNTTTSSMDWIDMRIGCDLIRIQ